MLYNTIVVKCSKTWDGYMRTMNFCPRQFSFCSLYPRNFKSWLHCIWWCCWNFFKFLCFSGFIARNFMKYFSIIVSLYQNMYCQLISHSQLIRDMAQSFHGTLFLLGLIVRIGIHLPSYTGWSQIWDSLSFLLYSASQFRSSISVVFDVLPFSQILSKVMYVGTLWFC